MVEIASVKGREGKSDSTVRARVTSIIWFPFTCLHTQRKIVRHEDEMTRLERRRARGYRGISGGIPPYLFGLKRHGA